MRVILSFLLLLSGCAGQGVRCDGHLSPINRPATVAQPGSAAPPEAPGGAP